MEIGGEEGQKQFDHGNKVDSSKKKVENTS